MIINYLLIKQRDICNLLYILQIVRHGQTQSNVLKINGYPDEPLNEAGRAQAQDLYKESGSRLRTIFHKNSLFKVM